MIKCHRHAPGAILLCCTVIFAGGCAALRKPKIVSESIATSRQLSRDGVAAMDMGDSETAKSLLSKAVDTSPTDIEARRHLAEVLWQQNNQRDAVVHLEAAVRLDPTHAPTVVRSGEMLLEIGATDSAAERAEQALSLDASLATAWALRGRVYRKKGDQARALADLQQSLRYSPHMCGVLYEVAEIQYQLGRPQRSLMTLHQLLDTYANGEEPQHVLWLEGLSYQAVERHQDAAVSLATASQRGQPQAELLYHLAQAEQAVGNSAAAVSSVKQALALDSGHQASQTLLAHLQSTTAPHSGGIIRR